MKKSKVLLGLFAGILALAGGSAKAQFHEIGPANIGGQVSSLVADGQDANGTTIYAGATTGGLYLRSSNASVLRNLYSHQNLNVPTESLVANVGSWHYVPFFDADGHSVVLPVSALTQSPDGTIFVGTGSNTYSTGSAYSKMSVKGRGIYRYSPSECTFTLIDATNPADNDMFAAVRALDFLYLNDTLFLYAATSTGLYRWAIGQESDWDGTAHMQCVHAGSVDHLVVARTINMAYFSSGNQLYKLTDAAHSTASVNISSSNTAFGGKNTAVHLAVAPSDNRYLYAMVIDSVGYMDKILLTTNGTTWYTISSENIAPLSYNSGTTCGAITVDPNNAKRVIVGGTSICIGQGYLEGAQYIWTTSSYSEFMLNGGNYMGSVYNSPIFVHSGIQQILPVWSNGNQVYYIATNGGVYSTSSNFYTYNNINRGLNNVQITSLAVCPDGSLISGAVDNACPFIEARLSHYGGTPSLSWYDDGSLGNLNHDANVLWTTSGGNVAASSFYQVAPLSRRNIFVSSQGRFARSYADYSDYTNTTTWTTDSAFTTADFIGTRGGFSLWENDHDSILKDSIKVALDMRGYYFSANGDTIWINQDATRKVKTNERAIFLSKNNSEYPFEYTFTSRDNNKSVADSFVVKNRVVSRALAIARSAGSRQDVIFSWMPNDFSHVWDGVIERSNSASADAEKEKMMKWVSIYSFNNGNDTLYPRDAVMSRDGRMAFISTYNTATHKSQLRRVKGFEKVNYYQRSTEVIAEMKYNSTRRVLTTELFENGSNAWFNRPISSIAVDPREGEDRLVLTFEDYMSGEPNVMIINNATQNNWSALPLAITGHESTPAYCAIVEKTTGHLYVGTAEGVFIYNGTSWSQYEHLRGVPVTAIAQQTREMASRSHLTHTGIEPNYHVYSKSKWPNAIYFGTYGRGIFLDMTYVTDTENEVMSNEDRNLGVPTVEGNGQSSVSIYPNPVSSEAHLAINAAESGIATLRVYDLNGRVVVDRQLGRVAEGEQHFTLATEGMSKGMYLVNVIIGGHTAATKMIVR